MSERRFDHASFRTLICDEPRPGVARITLNRPAQMNAYTFEMTQDLLSAVAAYRDDDSLKALILTGYYTCETGAAKELHYDPIRGRTPDFMEFDAIVVGSGITGGWAAKELTEAGLKVLMIERGRAIRH
eukprot:gene18374-22067_t